MGIKMDKIIFQNIEYKIGDTIDWNDVNGLHKGIVKFGTYADGEGYTTIMHLGFYVFEENNEYYKEWHLPLTLPDVINEYGGYKVYDKNNY
jgi:hypothetical protein